MMQEIEFILYADGRVEERVTGIRGTDCTQLTAALEATLGVVRQVQPTPEYFQAQNTQTVQQWT